MATTRVTRHDYPALLASASRPLRALPCRSMPRSSVTSLMSSTTPCNRIIFLNSYPGRDDLGGLWEMDAESRRFRRLPPNHFGFDLPDGFADTVSGSPRRGDNIVMTTSIGIYTFDLSTDRAKAVYQLPEIVRPHPATCPTIAPGQ